jgi:hypothetical protein
MREMQKHCAHTIAAPLFALLLSSGITSAGKEPFLIIESSLGEGVPVLTSLGIPIPIHQEPNADSKRLKFLSLPRGQKIRIQHNKSVIIIRKPGIVRVLKTTSLKGESYGQLSVLRLSVPAVQKTFSLQEGSTFGYLCYAGEGFCVISISRNIIITEQCEWIHPNIAQSTFKLETEGVIEWWFKIDHGWARIDSKDAPFQIDRDLS